MTISVVHRSVLEVFIFFVVEVWHSKYKLMYLWDDEISCLQMMANFVNRF